MQGQSRQTGEPPPPYVGPRGITEGTHCRGEGVVLPLVKRHRAGLDCTQRKLTATPTSHHLGDLHVNFKNKVFRRKLKILSSWPLDRQRFLKQDTKSTN